MIVTRKIDSEQITSEVNDTWEFVPREIKESVVRINPVCIKRVNFREKYITRFLTGQTKLSVFGDILDNIVSVTQICNELNKRIFCYKNQTSGQHILNIKRWRQLEYRHMRVSPLSGCSKSGVPPYSNSKFCPTTNVKPMNNTTSPDLR